MDMLYSKYSCPMDLVNRYIRQGRFDKFVQDFLAIDNERRKEQAEKENDFMLWLLFIDSKAYFEHDFNAWKKIVIQQPSTTQKQTRDTELDDDGIMAIIDRFKE